VSIDDPRSSATSAFEALARLFEAIPESSRQGRDF
jgi:hypothetical protein